MHDHNAQKLIEAIEGLSGAYLALVDALDKAGILGGREVSQRLHEMVNRLPERKRGTNAEVVMQILANGIETGFPLSPEELRARFQVIDGAQPPDSTQPE